MKIWGFIGFVLVASIKFLVAPPIALYGIRVGLWETISGMILGGIVGVFTFYFAGNFFIKRSMQKRIQRLELAIEKGESPPKIFTKRNKRIIRIKHKLGIFGVVFIALPLVSLPVEGILCAKFFRHDRRLIPLLIISVVAWSFILSLIYSIFRLGAS